MVHSLFSTFLLYLGLRTDSEVLGIFLDFIRIIIDTMRSITPKIVKIMPHHLSLLYLVLFDNHTINKIRPIKNMIADITTKMILPADAID